MTRNEVILRTGVFVLVCGMAVGAVGQSPEQMAQIHLDKARAAAWEPGRDFTYVFDALCREPRPSSPSGPPAAPAVRTSPPREAWYAEPAKVFDNLYYVGSIEDAAWAVTTSDGIILIDTTVEYNVEAEVVEGLEKLGLDPTQIKYAVVSHAHGDRYFGAKYLQERFGTRIILSEADWDVMARSNEPDELKPRKDMVATDGMELTLGDTTLTLYITPGHTPGTISTLVPLKDGDQQHLGSVWGGNAFGFERYGIRYFPTETDAIRTWAASSRRFMGITREAGADVYLTIHAHLNKTFDLIDAIRFRRPGDPHPFVDPEAIQNHLTVSTECMEAQLAWRGASD